MQQLCDDRGIPDCQSGAVHSLVCGTIIYMAVACDLGVCHAGSHGGDCSKALCDQGYSIGRSARFYSGERAGTVGAVFGKADRLLEDSAFGDDRDYAQSSNVSHCIRRDIGSLWISVIEGYRAEHISPVASPVGEPTNGVGEGVTDVSWSG